MSDSDDNKTALMTAIKMAQVNPDPQASFDDRFPSDPSFLQQIGAGLSHGAEGK
jgi:hypothetical protein